MPYPRAGAAASLHSPPMAARDPRKSRGSRDSDSKKPSRRRTRRAEAAASPWWFGPPEVPGDEGEDSGLLAAHKLLGMFDVLADAIAEERRERITIRRADLERLPGERRAGGAPQPARAAGAAAPRGRRRRHDRGERR
jgi:hypothetical protein